MRFLFVAAFAPIADSGAAGTLLALGAALGAQGHVVDFAWEPPGRRRIPHATASRLLELPRLQLRQVAGQLSRVAYDVVIVSQPFAYLVYERLRPRYPRTLFLNRTHGWEARLYEAQRRLGFAEARGADERLLSRVAESFMRRACARTARASHAVITPASRAAEYVRAAYGLSHERVPVIPYGLDEAGEHLASLPAARRPQRRMLFVGSYLRRKGAPVLEALLPPVARDFPDATLTLVTSAAAAPGIEACYRDAFGERLTVLAWMDRDRLNDVYAAHDILLFPSLFEGFGKVWMEAMAAGLCVVGFGEGGLPDVARDGLEASYCRPGDVGTLNVLLREALAQPARAGEMGARARERIRHYTWTRTAQETLECCRALGAR